MFRAGLAVALCGLSMPAAGIAQAEVRERAPGLILTVETGVGEHVVRDARVSRAAALFVAGGAPVTPFAAPGPFRATWRGGFEVRFRDRYRFVFEGNGQLELLVDGSPVQPGVDTRLRRGIHELELRYASPATGPAQARLLWQGSDFVAEPLPPGRLSHDPGDPELLYGIQKRRGRQLMADLQCTKCHIPSRPLVLTDGAMPEIARDAPMLTGVGSRLRGAWLARWVLDPKALRPDARMPKVLHGELARGEADDVATYLASLGTPAPSSSADVGRGGVLFAQLGCIACHTRPDAAADGERVALSGVAQKWHPAALSEFLADPARNYEWIEMPDFDLEQREAEELAAFLLAGAEPATGAREPAGDVDRGRELVQTRGCLKCHFVGELGSFRGPDWDALVRRDHGCLSDGPAQRGVAPNFAFDDEARDQLRAAFAEWESLARCVPVEFAARQLRSRRCVGCHEVDGQAARWSVHIDEVAPLLADVEPPKLAQHRPSLDGAGDKLRTSWTAALLRGEIGERSRPWLRARMPSFAAAADTMAAGLAAQFGNRPEVGSDVFHPTMLAVGEKLVGAQGGFACVLCHALGEQAPIGVFEVQGTNFDTTVNRLRKPYFHRWMQNPLRIDPSSRMPKYTDDRGKTGFTDVYDGDGRRQFEAMWHYLRTVQRR